jgi:hypothetical protein
MAESSRKCTRAQLPYSDQFKTKGMMKLYNTQFKDKTVLMERSVVCTDFVNDFGFIPQIFANRGWMFLIPNETTRAYVSMVREFYTNIEPIDQHSFTTYVRSHAFTVDGDLIRTVTGVHLVEESQYPYMPDVFPSKDTMMEVFVGGRVPCWPVQNASTRIADFSAPMRILSRIVSCNLWPIGHYSDFGVDRAAFLYALATEVPIDFASHAIRLMLAAFEEGNLSLPFGGLISHIFAHLGIEPEEGEPVITSIASFDKRTIAKSSGQVDRHIRRQAAARNPNIAGASSSSTPPIPQDAMPMMLEKFSLLSSQVQALGENMDKLSNTLEGEMDKLRTSLQGEIQSIKDFLNQGD